MKNIILLFFSLLFCYPLISQTNFKITGGNLKVTGDVDIVLQNTSWTNNANFSATDGAVILTGDAATADAQISGSSETAFHNLTINKAANDAQLTNNIEITNQLTLQSGLLDISDFNLDLGAVGLTNFNGQNYILTSGTGMVIRQIQNGNSANFMVGDGSRTPMIIQNSGDTDEFSVRAKAEVLENGTSGNTVTSDVVNRTWHIEEAVSGGNDLTLTVQWNATDELTGFNRDNCYLAHFDGAWDAPAPGAATGSDPYQISRSGVTNLSPFAVTSGGVLPVELLSFRAFLEDEKVQLEWETANEINNSHFEIEHSLNGRDFVKIGEMAGAGTANELQFYDFLHKYPSQGLNYYRLKQYDFDGKFEFSNTEVVNYDKFSYDENAIRIFPNPTNHWVYFEADFLIDRIRLLDSTGKEIIGFLSENQRIDLSKLPNGLYLLQFQAGDNLVVKRINKF